MPVYYDGILLCMTSRITLHKKFQYFGNITAKLWNYNPRSTLKYMGCDHWPIIQNTVGYSYQFYATHGEVAEDLCCDDLFDSDFNYKNQNINERSVCGNPDCRNGYEHIYLALKEEYADDFCALLDRLLDESDIHMVMFLVDSRCSVASMNCVTGYVRDKEFMKMLKEGKVYADVCYIVASAHVNDYFAEYLEVLDPKDKYDEEEEADC